MKIYVLLILFLPSCYSGIPRDPDTLIIGLENSPTRLDPRLSSDLASAHISDMVYNGLLKINADGILVPDLAESWEVPDDKTIVFHLKKGVRFHNGKELDSSDVEYTFRTLLDPNFKSSKAAAYKKLDGIETPSRYHVIFRLKEPFAPFLYNMDQGILPKDQMVNPQTLTIIEPVGTGPFQFVKYDMDEKGESHLESPFALL